MTHDQVQLQIISLFEEICWELDPPEQEPGYPIPNWGMDEVDEGEFLMALEDTFNVEISDDEFESCVSLDDLTNLVTNKL